MSKISSSDSFFKLNKQTLRTLGPYDAIVLAYVAEFHNKGLPCFASRKHIASETGFAEKTIQNIIKKLVKSGHLILAYEGRKRILSMADGGGKKYPQGGHEIPTEGVRDTQMRGHEILNTKINNTKINILSNEHIMPPVNNSVDKSKVSFEMVWDETKQAMVRRRVAC